MSVLAATVLLTGLSLAAEEPLAGCMGRYPGYLGAISVRGTVELNGSVGDSTYIELSWNLRGLESDAKGGIHIHTGKTCEEADAVGGHLYDTEVDDPWNASFWESDADGAASASFRIDGTDGLTYPENVDRAVVVHDAAGARIACGVLTTKPAELACPVRGCLQGYPGYAGDLRVRGSLEMEGSSEGVTLNWILEGLEAEATGGIHIHTGYTCDDPALVGGHLWDDSLGADPWTESKWESNAGGDATGSFSIAGNLGYGFVGNLQRAVVVHDAAGARIACGVLDGTCTESGCMGAYPGYEGDIEVSGQVSMTADATGVTLSWTLYGVENRVKAGIHIHTGDTCDDADLVGGHLWDNELGEDPWNESLYRSSRLGLSEGSFSITDGLGYGFERNSGRAVVVHDAAGARIGCALLSFAGCTSPRCGRPGKVKGEDRAVVSKMSVSSPCHCEEHCRFVDEAEAYLFKPLSGNRAGREGKSGSCRCFKNVDRVKYFRGTEIKKRKAVVGEL